MKFSFGFCLKSAVLAVICESSNGHLHFVPWFKLCIIISREIFSNFLSKHEIKTSANLVKRECMNITSSQQSLFPILAVFRYLSVKNLIRVTWHDANLSIFWSFIFIRTKDSLVHWASGSDG